VAECKIIECKTCWCITQAADFQMLIVKCYANALKKCISAVSNYVIFLYCLKFWSSNLHIFGIKTLVTILILCSLKQTNTLSLIVPQIGTGICRENRFTI